MIKSFSSDFEDFLRDESRRVGSADSISFPEKEADVVEIVREIGARSGRITTQGARTGIVAGAVPNGGHILNLSRMKSIGEVREDGGMHTLAIQPGALLDEVREKVAQSDLFFPPDPTETSASIGGMVASNASGAMSFFYGPTRRWVESVRVVLADGDVLALRRGECVACGRDFSLATESGRIISGKLPEYVMPNVKSAAGYYVADSLDLLDLFIGMEGTLGVITEIELRLVPKPKAINGLVVFLPSEEAALKLVRFARGESGEPPALMPVAIEFFNCDALELLCRMKSAYPAFEKIPTVKPSYHTAVYVEFHGDDDEALEEAVMGLIEYVAELGGSDEDTWFATTPREMEPLKSFRHAIPEAVNLLIDERKRGCPGLTKLGTDMSVPGEALEQMLAAYDKGLAELGLESVIFGHIGDNHVHVNILPNSLEDYEKGKALYLSWANEVVSMGGSISAEHGIGKLKVPFLKVMYGDEAIDQMRNLKRLFDPGMMLNPGNLFEE